MYLYCIPRLLETSKIKIALIATKMNTTSKAYTLLTSKGFSTGFSKNSSVGFWKAKYSLLSSKTS